MVTVTFTCDNCAKQEQGSYALCFGLSKPEGWFTYLTISDTTKHGTVHDVCSQRCADSIEALEEVKETSLSERLRPVDCVLPDIAMKPI